MLLSVVMPVYNEAEVLPKTFQTLRKVLAGTVWSYELIFVDDGSRDTTAEVLRQEAGTDSRVKVLNFSRNFGHQAAVTAGLDFAAGDAVVVMDADLQDPPELLPVMLEKFEQGYDVISAQRARRETDTWFKKMTAASFYWVMQHMADERILPEVGDFRMFSRRALLAIRQFREQHRFMRGLIAWLGLKEITVPFDRAPRAAGETKYPLSKMLRFAWTAISSFSAMPLRLSIGLGILLTAVGFVYFAYALYQAYITHDVVHGWTSVVVLQCLFSGGILVVLGLIGDYIARIYEESKGRPLYVVSETCNITASPRIERAVVLEPREDAPELRNRQAEAGRWQAGR